jgi:cephalosporin-C deacetylase
MPLLFDMSMERLQSYQGTNPRPDDFDDYWERALTELDSIPPAVELIPADFQAPYADCFHMYFTGTGGARVHAKLLRPKNATEPHPAVLMFHGYSGDSGDWQSKLGYVAAGYTVAALDCRGQGGLSEDVGGVPGWTLRGHIVRGLEGAPEDLLYRHIFLDCARMAQIVMDMPDVDETRVGATGGSQGGALTLACVALEPRVKQAAPIYPFLSDYKRVWDIDMDKDAYAELREWFRKFDPRHEREEEIFTRLGYIDIQFLAPRIRAEVMMGVGEMDQICPPSSQYAAFNKITSPKQAVHYPDFGHEKLPDFDDRIFGWMMEL